MKFWKSLLLICNCVIFFCTCWSTEEIAQRKKEEHPEAKWSKDNILIVASLPKTQFTTKEALDLNITFKNDSTKEIYITICPMLRRTFSYEIYDVEANKIVLQRDYNKMFIGDFSGTYRNTSIFPGKSFNYEIDLRKLYDLPPNREYRLDITGPFYLANDVKRFFTIKDLKFSIKNE